MLEGKKVGVYGKGANIRDWLFVEDHCEAVKLVLEKGVIGETYCVGGGYEKTNLEITKTILKLMGFGFDKIEFVKDRPGHDFRYAIDFSKIRRELGWTPRTSFEKGVRQTIAWYKKNQSWWKKLKNAKKR